MIEEGIALFGEPMLHGLNYNSCFLKELAKDAPNDIVIIEVDGTISSNDHAMTNNPKLFYHTGHGTPTRFTVECKSHYIDNMTGERMDKFVGMVVHLMSCETAQELGPALIANGVLSYLGYDDLFIYGIVKEDEPSPTPLQLPTDTCDFYTFADADVEVERNFVRQSTLLESFNASQTESDYLIDKYTTGEWKDRYIAPYSARYLRSNKDAQKIYGDLHAKLGTTTIIPPPEVGWSPLHWAIGTVEETRPKIPVELLEKVVFDTALKVQVLAPKINVGGSPPPKPPKIAR